MSYQSVFRPDLFKGQTLIVTGGGSGLGRCAAHELSALGAHVALVGRRIEKLNAVEMEIVEDGGSVSVHPCDIRDEEAVGRTIDAVLQARGRVDGLVNNAGGQYRAAMETISTKGFEAVIRNNLTGGFIFMREVYNRWMAAHGGAIVNIIADIWNGWPEFAHSAAARGGMWTLTETAACEWACAGVRVNAVAPGGIASSGFDTYPPEAQAKILAFPPDGAVATLRYGISRSPPPSSICCRRPRPTSPAPACASTAAPRMRDAPGRWPRRSEIRLSTAFTVRRRRASARAALRPPHQPGVEVSLDAGSG